MNSCCAEFTSSGSNRNEAATAVEFISVIALFAKRKKPPTKPLAVNS